VEHYRAGHGIATAHERGKAGTEELRKALQHYRALFEELLEVESRQEVAR
jgi:pyridoxal biosynthesis lyase PdxS